MKKNILLLFSLLIFSACESQLGTAISSTFSNIVSGKAFLDSSGDEAYSAMKKTSLENPVATLAGSGCVSLDTIIPLDQKESGAMSKIKDKLCTCLAWGTCDSKSCSCDNLCPNNFGIIKKLSAPSDAIENTFSFTNKNNKFSGKLDEKTKKFIPNDRTYSGYCWGISILSQRFHRLVTYEPHAEKKFQGATQDRERISEYKRIIAKLNNNEPVSIPGFKSLRDFSSDPEVKDLLEDSVKDIWAENALTTQGLKSVTSIETPSKPELNELFDDIEFRLKNNLSPSIIYNLKTGRTESHVLLVSGTGVFESGERYLCLNDNAYTQSANQNCNVKMIMEKDGSLVRKFGEKDKTAKGEPIYPAKIGKVALTHSENTNTMEQVSNLHKKCAGEKRCPQVL